MLGIAAAAGAAGAIALTRESAAPPPFITATGGNATVPVATGDDGPLATWPSRDGWTIVLVSVAKAKGRDEALAVAERARSRGLEGVGILDSARFSSLHPGFWLVFSGVYASEAEATGSLRPARAVSKSARVQRIAR